jgi:cytidylate kinase
MTQPRKHQVIAIDGPAASGKSSTAQWVAQELGYRHVDSGALYRGVTAARLDVGGAPDEWSDDSLLEAAGRVSLVPREHSFRVLIDGEEAEDRIRDEDVTRAVSAVATRSRVRDWVNARVREVANGMSVVVDGRDIGTAVFPDAQMKIFLVADPWERARRRLLQRLERRPLDEEIAEETERLVQRDARDATQTVQARDAVLVDTTYLTQREQVERIVALARAAARVDGPASDEEAGIPAG